MITEKQAYFLDNNGNELYANIRIIEGIHIGIDTYNQDNKLVGYIRIFFHPNNRIYLDVIYCYDEFRGLGIATLMNELADYIMRNYQGYTIRGVYEPGQLSTDRENNIVRSNEELELAARKFYAKAGYEIIEYQEYIEEKEKYPYLNAQDFNRGEDGPTTIVAKEIKPKEYQFFEEDNIIYHINYKRAKGRI